MTSRSLQTISMLSLLLILATLATGCSVGKAPVEPGGNIVEDGSLIWYVDAVNGSTYGDGRTPQTAFNTLPQGAAVALPGDIVEVANGTYSSSSNAVLEITTGGSAAGGYITWMPYPGEHPVIQSPPFGYKTVDVENGASYIIFEDFNIEGYNNTLSLQEGIGCEGQAGTQQACIINNAGCLSVSGPTVPANGPLPTPDEIPTHIQFLNNTIAYCGGGAGSTAADYITISGNTIYGNSWYTIYASSGVSMLGNYDTNPTDTTSHRMQITDNVFYTNEEFIPWVEVGEITDGEQIILDSNLNEQYVGAGLPYAPYGGRFLVANNVIYNGGSSAIEVFESSHADVINNSTFNNNLNQNTEAGRGEISISGSADDVNVFNNIFYSGTDGMATPLAIFGACATSCHIDYNDFYGGVAPAWGTSNFGAAAKGSHNIAVDPMYVTATFFPLSGGTAGAETPTPTDLLSAPTENLKLQPGSPAIGAGVATFNGISAPATDFSGTPRPSANGWTLGAYSE